MPDRNYRHSVKKIFLVSGISLLLNISGCVLEPFLSESSFALTQNIGDRTIAQTTKPKQSPKVVLQGEKGNYTAQLEVTGTLEKAWEVLTDYDNFENFIPNTVDSQILEENGNSLIFQQTNSVDLILLTQEFSVKIATTKNPRQQINFEMLEGDLGSLTGSWQLEPVANNQIKIIHQVQVTPRSASEAIVFYPIYESSLEETLNAIAKEIIRRSQI